MKWGHVLLGLFCIFIVGEALACKDPLPHGAPTDAGVVHLEPPSHAVQQSYFGMHIHRASSTTPWPAVPFGSWRLWDARTTWPDIEPQRGSWNFSVLDAYLKLAKAHHVQVLLPLGLSPKWASARPYESSIFGPGKAAEPRILSDWDEYVRKVAEHCKGKVQAYEIWNEPNFNVFWSGDTATMVELTRRAYQIIKHVDPKASIVSPSATASQRGNDWLKGFLAKGGGSYVDVIGFHFYAETPEKMVPLIAEVRQTMATNGIGAMPLWNTETGWSKPKPFPSEELGAAYLVRAYLLNWAAGVQRLYWYAWDNHGFSTIQSTYADDRTLTPAGQAFATVQTWLIGVQLQSCDMDAEHTWTCSLHGAHADRWVIWNPDREIEYTLPPEWHARTTTVLNGTPVKLTSAEVTVTKSPQLVEGKLR